MVRQPPEEPTVGKSYSVRRTSGIWSVPCSRIQRNRASSILISTRPMGMGPKWARETISVALAESQHHVIDPTNPGGALDDGVEDRLHVRGRAADDARAPRPLPSDAPGPRAILRCARRVSLNKRTFSMAMTAWLAKVSRSLICLSVNGRTSVRRIRIDPRATPSRSKGAHKSVRVPKRCWASLLSGNLVSTSAARS